MIKIYDKVVQGTDEWKELRWGKIGGSSLKDVMANENKSIVDNAIFSKLQGELMEEFDPFEENKATIEMQRGNELEPIAAEEFSRITGKNIYEIGWAELDDKFTGISPDRLIGKLGDLMITEALEIKCPSRNTYAQYLYNNNLAIEKYSWQIVQNFLIFDDLEVLHFFIYRPENEIKSHILVDITRNTEIQVNKKKKAKVYELVIEAKERIEELKRELEISINKLKQPIF